MSRAMKRVVIETVVPENFKYIARDQDGSVHVFEEKPNLDYGSKRTLSHVICGMCLKVKPCRLVQRRL